MIRWNDEKAELLKNERNIIIKDIAGIIKREEYIDIRKVPSQQNHPEQIMFVVEYNDYIHCVPFIIEDDGNIFIKTAFPTRRLNTEYLHIKKEKKNEEIESI